MTVLEIIYPGNLNWFYRHQAKAFVEDLNLVGCPAVCLSAAEFSETPSKGDTVLILSQWESIVSAEQCGQAGLLLKKLRTYQNRILLNFDSIFTQYFRRHFVHEEDLITHIIDIGHFKQFEGEFLYFRPYRWIPECFTLAEIYTLDESIINSAYEKGMGLRREFPWAAMGHSNVSRSALILACMKVLGTNGFVFTPPVRPFDQNNALEMDSIATVLKKSEIYVWGSHHPHPYHEGLRAQHALLSGAVPLKIDPINYDLLKAIPWVYPNLASFENDVRADGIPALFSKFRAFAMAYGAVGPRLASCLGSLDVVDGKEYAKS